MHYRKFQTQASCRYQALILLVPIAVAVGCKHGNAINFVTNTQFGLKVGVNAEKIPEVQIGYNRQEAARIPVYLEQQSTRNQPPGDGFAAAPVSVNSLASHRT